MTAAAAGALWVGAWLLVAALARSPGLARLARLLMLPLLAAPWWLAAGLGQRLLLAFALAVLLASAFDFMAGRRPSSFAGRLRYMLAFAAMIDAASAMKVRPQFDLRAVGGIALALVIAAFALSGWTVVAAWPGLVRVPLRLAAAATLVLSAAELHGHMVRLLSVPFGVRFADTFDQPYRSCTLTAFWSRRWNRLGARWFRQHAFLPLRGRSVTLALFALFGFSAVGHAYLIAAALPLRAVAMWAAFFLLQAPLIMAERRLQVRRWPPLAARAWTVAVFIALMPLFIAPLLDAWGLSL